MTKKPIKSLRLVNFKAFTDQVFELKPLTLLSGLNNTGKSCVLQSILLLRQTAQQSLLSEGLALNGDLVCIGTGQDALNEWADNDFIVFEVIWNDDIKAIWRFEYKMLANVLSLISLPVTQSVMDKNIFSSKFYFLSSCQPNYKPNFEILEQLQEGSVLILEHPEHLLDSRSQTRIGKVIAECANRGVQIILETHSDHILNSIRISVHGGIIKPEDVQLHHFHTVENKGKREIKIISPRIDRNGRIDRWEDGFFDEWEKVLEKLLIPATIS